MRGQAADMRSPSLPSSSCCPHPWSSTKWYSSGRREDGAAHLKAASCWAAASSFRHQQHQLDAVGCWDRLLHIQWGRGRVWGLLVLPSGRAASHYTGTLIPFIHHPASLLIHFLIPNFFTASGRGIGIPTTKYQARVAKHNVYIYRMLARGRTLITTRLERANSHTGPTSRVPPLETTAYLTALEKVSITFGTPLHYREMLIFINCIT